MNVRRRNKRERKDLGPAGGLPRDLPGLEQAMALERDRLVRVSQERKKVDYVLRLKRYGFKMGEAHKA
ncbi:hypothetical protein SEA_BILLDOOR_54 [Gordonia phage BillDoor]